METPAHQLRAFILAIGVHLICVLLLFVGLTWTHTARPVSVPGPIIEATLVSYTPPTRKALPKPVKPAPPKPEPTPVEAPPRADDAIDREQIDRMALEAAERAEREQDEMRKREQELLEAEEQTRIEREREERQLALLEERERQQQDLEAQELERELMDELLEQEQAGNERVDEGLQARYIGTLQQIVTQNWLRPDTALPGLNCTVRIVQIPGGEVLSASVVPPCNGDDLTRRSVEAAVLRAQPLPYQGYESVFSRSIDFVFHYDG